MGWLIVFVLICSTGFDGVVNGHVVASGYFKVWYPGRDKQWQGRGEEVWLLDAAGGSFAKVEVREIHLDESFPHSCLGESTMTTPCDPVYPQYPAYAVGFYNTHVVNVLYDNDVIDGLLPDELERAPQTLSGPGQHPVTFLFGRHSHVRPNFIPFGGMNYYEFIFAIPFVQWKDPNAYTYRGPFAYMPRMFLDKLFPTILGHFYAYPKELARIHGGNDYDVHSLLLDKPLLRGEFSPYGAPAPPDDFANFAPIREIFELPFIGQWEFGPYVCSKLTFLLDESMARPSDAVVEIQYEFLPGITPRLFTLPGLDVTPMGSFTLSVPWNLTLPFSCGCIECSP